MTVRTDKIQSLTGSAPLTLPKTLPSSKTNLKVDSSGNMTTSSASPSFSSLRKAGETGWVLLGSTQTNDWTNGCEVSIEGSGYSGSDIYVYRIEFDIEGNRQNGNNMRFDLAPYAGTTNISNQTFTNNGFKNMDNSMSNSTNATGAQTGAAGYELYMAYNISGNSNSTYDYESMFDPSIVNENYSYRGGMRGCIRYYNGAGMRASFADPVGMYWDEWDSSRYNSNQAYYWMQVVRRSQTAYDNPSNSSFADKFRIHNSSYSQDNGGSGNTSYYQRGMMTLYGIPKTG